MATSSLTNYTCDECGISIISENKPRGWVRILSTRSRTGNTGTEIQHHSFPPVLYSPSRRVTTIGLPEKAWWCSPDCLARWVHRKADDVIERAKTN